jgi:UDP-N-acetylmuramoylalanine--D-glutamate ligase
MNKSLNGKKIAVLGIGVSNMSALRYLIKHDLKALAVFDSRQKPPRISEIPSGIEVRLGEFSAKALSEYDMLVLGPGISSSNPVVEEAARRGAEIVGDVELFAREVRVPVIGITGSNGKSTVTTLTAMMARKDGINAAMGANIGIPVFDAIRTDADLYVLELSSFELETTSNLKLKAGTILNVSEDHLDRYHGSIEEYAAAKQRIYRNCEKAVVNRNDPRTMPSDGREPFASFGTDLRDYGIMVENGGRTWLCVKGKPVYDTANMHIYGVHNQQNALACMALCDAAGISRKAQLAALDDFTGLPHRCQLVSVIDGVSYYNDSKATNVASAQAAIEGLAGAHPEGILLLAGGLGKGQDFSPLRKYIGKEVKDVYCFGRDAAQLLALDPERCHSVMNMRQALNDARAKAKPGQAVLLSPACASFDQFKGFEERGEIFVGLVRRLEEADRS